MFTNYKSEDAINILSKQLIKYYNGEKEVVVACIGANTIVYDSLGPLVGSYLKEIGCKFTVYGTMYKPINSLNSNDYADMIKGRHPNAFVIAIDVSTVSNQDKVLCLNIKNEPIAPGLGAGMVRKSIGSISFIAGICVKGQLQESKNIELRQILDMAKVITDVVMKFQNFVLQNTIVSEDKQKTSEELKIVKELENRQKEKQLTAVTEIDISDEEEFYLGYI